MNKPITIVIKETTNKLANVCNESGLSPAILDLIVQNFYANIHSLANRQAIDEEMSYAKMLEEAAKKTDVADESVD